MAVLVLSTGCGTGAVGEVVRPNGPTAAEALGEAPCLEVGQRDAPLIIDWPSDSRTDLEVAMQAGVAVVSYSCAELRLRSECQVSGDYGFVGVSRKEDFVQLDSRDEIRANLPVEGVTLSAGLASGSSLDLALITVGKRGSSRRELGHGDLTGDCAGATHFVRSAYVGAFAMEVGSVGRARTAAEVFGAGVSATSESKQTVARRDGSLEACRAATPDDEQPRDQCGAATRVQLYALSAAAPAKTALPTCPAGAPGSGK